MTRWATFDCYGTLVDWDGGIGAELARLWPDADAPVLLARYHEIEPRVQAGAALPYRHVLRESLRLLADHEGLPLATAEEDALADALPRWPVFPEVPASLRALRGRGWRLAVLSNTDPDLLAASLDAIGVPFDVAITAAEARSYKPAHGHWERFFAETDANRAGHVHVAASAYHDLGPAAELGLAAVWINRLGEESDLPRAAELPDLAELPDTLERLVPAATLSG
ncbi:MAG TPA: HAD-IA family hydrolase [Gaiellaceae bacterium]|nr:HAD-IA family hydrolase [Gaiellaceae bacterium]